MKMKTVKDHEGKKHSADTARAGGAAYAPHEQSGENLAESVGDNRTPDKTIGEIKYAKKPDTKPDTKQDTKSSREPASAPADRPRRQ